MSIEREDMVQILQTGNLNYVTTDNLNSFIFQFSAATLEIDILAKNNYALAYLKSYIPAPSMTALVSFSNALHTTSNITGN